MTAGAELFDSVRGFMIGVVVDAYPLPYREDVADITHGIIRRTPVEGMEFTYIVVEATAQITDYATSIGQFEIAVNKEVTVKSKAFAGKGYITAIEKLN